MKGRKQMNISIHKHKDQMYVAIYFIACFVLAYIGQGMHINVISLFISALTMLLLMRILDSKLTSFEEIYSNRKSLYVFGIIYTLNILIALIIVYVFSMNNSNINGENFIIALIFQFILNSLLFICYGFKIKLSDFNWHISLSSLLYVFAIFLVGRPLFFLLANGTTNITQIFSIKFYVTASVSIFYPAIFEELLYRGFLISGLKSFGLADWKCNIIQSILFGIMHIFGFGVFSFKMLFTTCIQTIIGYVFGKLYFKTKSLSPCILLHALWNSYMF